MLSRSILITGTDRGIGLELVKQLAKQNPGVIVATCLDPLSPDLQLLSEEHDCIRVLKLDVTDYDKYDSIVAEVSEIVGEDGLNLLINNAGVAVRRSGLEYTTPENMRVNFEINTIAPLLITKACLPLLKKASEKNNQEALGCKRAAVINITSELGSLSQNTTGSYYAYRGSKAALNMFTKSLSIDLASDKILVTGVHPGWVQTDMGGPRAPVKVEESVDNIIKVMATLNESHSGLSVSFDGSIIPF